MTDRIQLTHLTFVGPNVEAASVEFGPRMTLVCGPSDTGKSFIVDAVDFMLGASGLKEIPERRDYTTALLGLRLADGSDVTLQRAVGGGGFALHRKLIRALVNDADAEPLAPKHSSTNDQNVSRFLLGQLGLDGRKIRKNQRDETISLSFRHIAHLCIVDETQMQAETPPALSGGYTLRTAEVSVLKMLLQDADDSALLPSTATPERKRLDAARIGVIDRLAEDLEQQLHDVPDADELQSQLARLSEATTSVGQSMEAITGQRSELTSRLAALQANEVDLNRELGDARALSGRLALLLQQYDTDLDRLEMIEEAGDLLGYFAPGVCAFCGAEPEDQRFERANHGHGSAFAQSVQAERVKTQALRRDLVATLDDLTRRRGDLARQRDEVLGEVGRTQFALVELETELRPHRQDLDELLTARSAVEGQLGLYAQLASVHRLRSEVLADVTADAAIAVSQMDLAALREFSREIAARLNAWGYPDAATVRYDRNEQDLVAGDQLRAAHGKGVRAVLHAAFTIALATYCIERDLPHPGFVVLDSPLVTYRAPDLADEGNGAALGAEVAEAFYRDLETNFPGQAVIFENTEPGYGLDPTTTEILFTKTPATGRYGFFPGGTSTA
jgi:hypothetical protein